MKRARLPGQARTGYGSFNVTGLSRLELIASTACGECGAMPGGLCQRANGTDRVQMHKSRWRDGIRAARRSLPC